MDWYKTLMICLCMIEGNAQKIPFLVKSETLSNLSLLIQERETISDSNAKICAKKDQMQQKIRSLDSR